jgi:nucleotide-binding universal stress UspA family protein
MTAFKTILHPTDFSASARQAFGLAHTLAAAHGSRLIVLHVHETTGPLLAFGAASVQLEPSKQLDKLLKVLRGFHASDPGVRVEHQIVTGEPAAQILRAADGKLCDLIVMGAEGSNGSTKSSVGSIAEVILQKAACPVLIMRARRSLRSLTLPARHVSEVAQG